MCRWLRIKKFTRKTLDTSLKNTNNNEMEKEKQFHAEICSRSFSSKLHVQLSRKTSFRATNQWNFRVGELFE